MAGSKKKKAVRRGLNRKQFLLGLVVVCGAALIIECALLIHTFSKKKEKPKENPTPTPTAAVAEQKNGIVFIKSDLYRLMRPSSHLHRNLDLIDICCSIKYRGVSRRKCEVVPETLKT